MVDHELRADDVQKEQRLDGWKQIAAYFTRSVRTVRRWEKREGLPVHRHMHVCKGTPYAYANELNEWMECRHAAPIGTVGRLRQEVSTFHGTAENIRSIVVLPFENMHSELCDKHFHETLTAEVISHIARLYPHKVRIVHPEGRFMTNGNRKSVRFKKSSDWTISSRAVCGTPPAGCG